MVFDDGLMWYWLVDGVLVDEVLYVVIWCVDVIVCSVLSVDVGDLVLCVFVDVLYDSFVLCWVGYLFLMVVYVDCDGDWVDEYICVDVDNDIVVW